MKLYRHVGTILFLFGAFWLAGYAAFQFELLHENILVSCGVFTTVFSGIIALLIKIHHFLFL